MHDVSEGGYARISPQHFNVIGIGLLACLPLLMVFPKWAGWLSGLLAIAGIIVLARNWKVYPLDWHFLVICIILPLAYIWNMVMMGWYPNYLSRPMHLLWGFLLYLLVGRYGVSRAALFYAACLTAFVALGIAIYEAIYLGHDRVFGLGQRWNAVPFGNFSMLFGFFCLSGALVEWKEKPRLHFLLALAGFFCGTTASVLSGSRGGWAAFPFLIMLCVLLSDRLERRARSVLILIAVTLVVAVFSSSERFHARFHEAREQIVAFASDPENPQARNGAVGIRLGMWYWGIKKFVEHPYTGIGIANYKRERGAAVSAGLLPEEFNRLANLHNELITSMALGGIPSAFALFLFWILAWRFFYIRRKAGSEEQHYFALCGLLTVMGTALFSMTEGLFGTSPGTKAIMLCLAISAGGMRYFYVKSRFE